MFLANSCSTDGISVVYCIRMNICSILILSVHVLIFNQEIDLCLPLNSSGSGEDSNSANATAIVEDGTCTAVTLVKSGCGGESAVINTGVSLVLLFAPTV